MATKKFSQMATKKLKALLETASEEDRIEIEKVLQSRDQVGAVAAPAAPAEQVEAPEAPAEQAPAKPAKVKMTDEERKALAEELKKNINHKCQAVPFNTAEWVDGYIAGVMEDKRTNKVLYAIKTVDGRRIVKVHDSELIRIFDETVEPQATARRSRAKAEKTEWTPEMIATEINEVIGNVGRTVEIERYTTTDEEGNEQVHVLVGRIVAIVPDKRAQRLLYRISVPTPMEGNPLATKIMHKVVKAEGLQIAEDFDEEGAKLNAKYCERRENAISRSPLTPAERVKRCEENLAKAEEKLKKLQEDVEAKKKQLEEAKKELEEFLNQPNGEQTEELA